MTLINQKPRDGPPPLCRFSPGFIESNVQALYDPARGNRISQTRHES
jgi:hypothetical protein